MEKKPHEDKNASKDAADKTARAEQEVEALKGRVAELETENAELREEKSEREARDAQLSARDQQRGVQIRTGEHSGNRVKPGKRLYLNAKKTKLVPEGHKDAASLYCTENQSVLRAEYERLKGR